MISLDILRDNIETSLNTITNKKAFKLFTSIGEFKKPFRNGNTITKYICGICSTMSSELTPLKSLSILTHSVNVEFVVKTDNLEKDDNGNYIEVLQVQDILNDFVQSQNGQNITLYDAPITDPNRKTYVVSISASLPEVGTEQIISPLGKAISISFQMFYTMVENGMNSGDVSITAFGEELPFISATISRVFTNTVVQKMNEEVGKTINEQNSLSIGMQLPLVSGQFGQRIVESLLKGKNNLPIPIYLQYKEPLAYSEGKVMTFSSLKNSISGVQNVGVELNLVEIDSTVANFDNHWAGRSFYFENTTNSRVTISISGYSDYIFIDDGNGNVFEYKQQTDFTTQLTYATSGNYNVRVYSSGNTPEIKVQYLVKIPLQNRLYAVSLVVGEQTYTTNTFVDENAECTFNVSYTYPNSARTNSIIVNDEIITNNPTFKVTKPTQVYLNYDLLKNYYNEEYEDDYFRFDITATTETTIFNPNFYELGGDVRVGILDNGSFVYETDSTFDGGELNVQTKNGSFENSTYGDFDITINRNNITISNASTLAIGQQGAIQFYYWVTYNAEV